VLLSGRISRFATFNDHPSPVLQSLSNQLAIQTLDGLQSYRKGEQREEHVTKIRKHYGYGDIT
jgi:hypothetical protein